MVKDKQLALHRPIYNTRDLVLKMVQKFIMARARISDGKDQEKLLDKMVP